MQDQSAIRALLVAVLEKGKEKYTERLFQLEDCRESLTKFILSGKRDGYAGPNCFDFGKRHYESYCECCLYYYVKKGESFIYNIHEYKDGEYILSYSLIFEYEKQNDIERIFAFMKNEIDDGYPEKCTLMFPFVKGVLQMPNIFDKEKYLLSAKDDDDDDTKRYDGSNYRSYFLDNGNAFLVYLETGRNTWASSCNNKYRINHFEKVPYLVYRYRGDNRDGCTGQGLVLVEMERISTCELKHEPESTCEVKPIHAE